MGLLDIKTRSVQSEIYSQLIPSSNFSLQDWASLNYEGKIKLLAYLDLTSNKSKPYIFQRYSAPTPDQVITTQELRFKRDLVRLYLTNESLINHSENAPEYVVMYHAQTRHSPKLGKGLWFDESVSQTISFASDRASWGTNIRQWHGGVMYMHISKPKNIEHIGDERTFFTYNGQSVPTPSSTKRRDENIDFNHHCVILDRNTILTFDPEFTDEEVAQIRNSAEFIQRYGTAIEAMKTRDDWTINDAYQQQRRRLPTGNNLSTMCRDIQLKKDEVAQFLTSLTFDAFQIEMDEFLEDDGNFLVCLESMVYGYQSRKNDSAEITHSPITSFEKGRFLDNAYQMWRTLKINQYFHVNLRQESEPRRTITDKDRKAVNLARDAFKKDRTTFTLVKKNQLQVISLPSENNFITKQRYFFDPTTKRVIRSISETKQTNESEWSTSPAKQKTAFDNKVVDYHFLKHRDHIVSISDKHFTYRNSKGNIVKIEKLSLSTGVKKEIYDAEGQTRLAYKRINKEQNAVGRNLNTSEHKLLLQEYFKRLSIGPGSTAEQIAEKEKIELILVAKYGITNGRIEEIKGLYGNPQAAVEFNQKIEEIAKGFKQQKSFFHLHVSIPQITATHHSLITNNDIPTYKYSHDLTPIQTATMPSLSRADSAHLPIFEFADNEHITLPDSVKSQVKRQQQWLIKQIEQYYWKYGTLPQDVERATSFEQWQQILANPPQNVPQVRRVDDFEMNHRYAIARKEHLKAKIAELELRRKQNLSPTADQGFAQFMFANPEQAIQIRSADYDFAKAILEAKKELSECSQKIQKIETEILHGKRQKLLKMAKPEYFFAFDMNPHTGQVIYTSPSNGSVYHVSGAGADGNRFQLETLHFDVFNELLSGNFKSVYDYFETLDNGFTTLFPDTHYFESDSFDLQTTEGRKQLFHDKIDNMTKNDKIYILKQTYTRLFECTLEKFFVSKIKHDKMIKMSNEIKELISQKNNSILRSFPGYTERKQELIDQKMNEFEQIRTEITSNIVRERMQNESAEAYLRQIDSVLQSQTLSTESPILKAFAYHSRFITEFFLNDSDSEVREIAKMQLNADAIAFEGLGVLLSPPVSEANRISIEREVKQAADFFPPLNQEHLLPPDVKEQLCHTISGRFRRCRDNAQNEMIPARQQAWEQQRDEEFRVRHESYSAADLSRSVPLDSFFEEVDIPVQEVQQDTNAALVRQQNPA